MEPTSDRRHRPSARTIAGSALIVLVVLVAAIAAFPLGRRWTVLGHLGLMVVPMTAILLGLRWYRPAHPAFWWALVAYFASGVVLNVGYVVGQWSDPPATLSFFTGTAARLAFGGSSSVAAVVAVVILLRIRRRDSATWALGDAVLVGLGLFTAYLIANLLPLLDRLGPDLALWTVGVVFGVRDLALICVAMVVLYSDEFRSRPEALFVALLAVWGLSDLIWLQLGASSTNPVIRSAVLVLLTAWFIGCTVVAVRPVMREVAAPSDSPRPAWALARTVGLIVCVLTPLAAFLVAPPRPGFQLVVVLAALASLLVAVILRLRSALLQAHRLLQQVEVVADHDQLTGLPNRRFLYGTMMSGLAEPGPDGEKSLVVHYLDLDNLREVNDRLEHSGGDRLLRAVARALVSTMGPDRHVVRVGGDEFVVVTVVEPGDDPTTRALATQTEVLRTLERLSADGFDSKGSVGTSWGKMDVAPGGSAGPAAEKLLDRLLQEADQAQAEAKRAGGARAVVFDRTMNERSRRRATLRRSLPLAWAGDEMNLDYQSVVDLRTGEIFGVESLLRWTHPTLGPVPPPDAIDTAVQLGLIDELGLQILARAQRDISGPGVPPQARVGVNVAAPQLRPAAIDALIESVRENGLAGRVWLEVTEQLLVDEQRYVAGAMADLRGAGLLIAIDDFGTGYCSLDYICSLPIDLVKLDKIFAAHSDEPIRRTVSRSVTQLAEAIGAEVIVEGIETLQSAHEMAALGCRFGQGFALRRPTPEITEALVAVPALAGPPAPFRPPRRTAGR